MKNHWEIKLLISSLSSLIKDEFNTIYVLPLRRRCFSMVAHRVAEMLPDTCDKRYIYNHWETIIFQWSFIMWLSCYPEQHSECARSWWDVRRSLVTAVSWTRCCLLTWTQAWEWACRWEHTDTSVLWASCYLIAWTQVRKCLPLRACQPSLLYTRGAVCLPGFKYGYSFHWE